MDKDLAPNTIRQYSRVANDPYGFAMRYIMSGINKSLAHQGRMSVEELSIILEIRQIIESRDPASLAITTDRR